MAVWLTKDKKVILIGDKVYTGSTNPCGYAYIQKCTYTAGTATSSPTNTAELLAVQVDNFCTYTNATVWFNRNSGTYPTSGEKSHTLLNSQLSGTESAAGWLTCADKSRIKLGTCSYNPKIYYVHSKCDCDAGTTKATITTSSSNSSYTEHEGPFVYAEAETRYNEVNNKSCTCAWYFAADLTDCSEYDNQVAPKYSLVSGLTPTKPSANIWDVVVDAGTDKAAAEQLRQSYMNATIQCTDLKWYLYVKCDNGQYRTAIFNDADGFIDYELVGVYNTRDEANAAAANYTGPCAEKYCVYLYCNPSTCKMEMKRAKVSATYSGTVTDYVNKLNESDSKWSPYSTSGSYNYWMSEPESAQVIGQWQPACCIPDCKREDGGGYDWYYAYCRDGVVSLTSFYNNVPKCTAAEYIAMQNASGKCYADEFGSEYIPMSAVAVTVVSGKSKRGFFRADATVKFGSCPSTAALLLSDTPDDLQ